MSDRQLSPDYELRGQAFELWADGHCNPGMYPSWWLSTEDPAVAAHCKVPLRTVLIDTDFDPPLSEKEVVAIGEYVLGCYA